MGDESGEEGYAGEVGDEAGADGLDVGDDDGGHEHFTGGVADLGYGGGYEADDDEGDGEVEEFGEDGVECDEDAREPVGEDVSGAYAEEYGDDDHRKESEFEFLFCGSGVGHSKWNLCVLRSGALL